MNSIITYNTYVRRLLRWGRTDSATGKRDRDNLGLEDEPPASKRLKENTRSFESRFPESAMVSKGPSTSTSASSSMYTPWMLNKSVDTRSLHNSRVLGSDNKNAGCTISSRSDFSPVEYSPNLENSEFISRRTNPNNHLFYKTQGNNKNHLEGGVRGKPTFRYRVSPEVVEIEDDLDDDVIYKGHVKQNVNDFQYDFKSPMYKNIKPIMHKVPIDAESKKNILKLRHAHNMLPSDLCSSVPLSSHHRKSLSNEIFKTPLGITKAKNSQSMSQSVGRNLIFPLRKQNSDTQLHSRCSQNVIDEIYRLYEKKTYSELIHKFTAKHNKPLTPLTTKSLRKKLNTIDLTEGSIFKLINGVGEVNGDKEYDPRIVASIHSSDSEIEILGATDDSRSSKTSINRVNSFKKDLEKKAFFNSNYTAELTKKYQSLSSDMTKIITNHGFKENLVTKINLETCKNIYADALMSKRSLKYIFIKEVKEEVALPELTEEQEKLVSYILNPHKNPDEVIIEKFRYTIRRSDLMTLDGLNWLNDEVINFYINLLMQRSQQRQDLPKVFGINTFFYPKLLSSGHAGLKRWTCNVDIFAHDLMIVPVHLNIHWCVSIINFKEKCIKYYDSMGGTNMSCCNALLKYLEEEHMEKKKQPLDSKTWKKECMKNIPHQMNGSDCGMFACTFSEFECRKAQMSFTQKDMPYLRRKMVIEIKEGKLLL